MPTAMVITIKGERDMTVMMTATSGSPGTVERDETKTSLELCSIKLSFNQQRNRGRRGQAGEKSKAKCAREPVTSPEDIFILVVEFHTLKF